ncbi:MAG: hypothetical protein AAF213_02260 [Pseudomonadota bacterium]
MSSINTSPPLFTLLQQINSTNDRGFGVRNQISTGNRFNGAEDPSNFAISQGLNSEIQALDAIDQALSSNTGAAVTALTASEFAFNLLSDATTNALLSLNPSSGQSEQAIFTQGFEDNLNQLNEVVENANFNGSNLANGDPAGGLNTVATLEGGQINTPSQNFTTAGLSENRTSIGEDGLDDIDLSDPATTIGDVNEIISDAEQQLALGVGEIAAGLNSLDRQREFNTAIQDATVEGLGSLRDADLARADARDEQIRVQQQLQFQVLNQQNQQRGLLVNLFA